MGAPPVACMQQQTVIVACIFEQLIDDAIFIFPYTDASDYQLSANSTVINVGEMMSCITVTAPDDELIEAEETLIVVSMPYNLRDTVDTNTTVTITDNDGK